MRCYANGRVFEGFRVRCYANGRVFEDFVILLRYAFIRGWMRGRSDEVYASDLIHDTSLLVRL
jgi:hypothetical protein